MTVTTALSGNMNLKPAGDLILYPQGGDVLPNETHSITLGSPTKKFKAVYASELNIETLVAQARHSRRRILVAPNTPYGRHHYHRHDRSPVSTMRCLRRRANMEGNRQRRSISWSGGIQCVAFRCNTDYIPCGPTQSFVAGVKFTVAGSSVALIMDSGRWGA